MRKGSRGVRRGHLTAWKSAGPAAPWGGPLLLACSEASPGPPAAGDTIVERRRRWRRGGFGEAGDSGERTFGLTGAAQEASEM